jgi:UDP-N-acetylmuramate--alanine ligase
VKIRAGILFGGTSKEREISFAGGRTVYDNLNKSLFEAIPIFVDSFGNFVLLDWQYVYKGSIRDFYPPVDSLPASKGGFQVYAENLGQLTVGQQNQLIEPIGTNIYFSELHTLIDFAFLCLHGANGEDGRIQGLLEYLNIPYSGSGILPSAIGMNKAVQKELMQSMGFSSPKFLSTEKSHLIQDQGSNNKEAFFQKAKREIGFPLVIKPANQGSSIGVSILHKADEQAFKDALDKAFFIRKLKASQWKDLSSEQQIDYVRTLADIREGIGMPLLADSKNIIHHPDQLIVYLNDVLKGGEEVVLESLDGESTVLVESFIEGKEFSCIVIQNEPDGCIALPPTEIRKGKELFDYRSKYLPGLSRKITPIDLPSEQISDIREKCELLFEKLHFDVYARIDGFVGNDNTVFLNDPNTTSGMMPSSFFFHQAAEIGLNPSQFLTYIIRTSLACRNRHSSNSGASAELLERLDIAIHFNQKASAQRIKVAVIFGGYSSERHISVESGRNVYEKLASSTKYEPIPVFLTGNEQDHKMYQIPVNLLLKDNADDIKDKIEKYKVHTAIQDIISECTAITHKYSSPGNLSGPRQITYEDLRQSVDCVFIALHGRPGEDGAVQKNLERVGLPYNGSGVESSEISIDKYRTNELLRKNGFLVAEHLLVGEDAWEEEKEGTLASISSDIHYPFIAKPVDDGCSSAVRKIKSKEEFEAYTKLIFRKSPELDKDAAELLHIKAQEEFPRKRLLLAEELISRRDARHFLEITGGMLTFYDKQGNLQYEVFEASEALSEGEVLSLEEKFLAGQGQNITPARYSADPQERQKISDKVKKSFASAARLLGIQGYARIDAFVRIYSPDRVEIIYIEVNSLPGMTPATCIFHQSALNGYKPYEFIDKIIDFAFTRKKRELV